MAGPNATARLVNGILSENPTFRQLLGMCPTLAVTSNLRAALTMACATAFVLFASNVCTSLMRNLLKPHLRILIYTITIATFVTLVDKVLAAFAWGMSKELGPYIPLVIVNCIIIARCEICAAKEGLVNSVADAAGQSLGFAAGLAVLALVRELLGNGSLFAIPVLPNWPGWMVMILPPGAFLALGLLLAAANWYTMAAKQRSRRGQTKE